MNWKTQRKYAIYCKYLRVILLNHIFVNSFHGRKTGYTMMSKKKTSFVGRARTSWNSSKTPVKSEKETGEGHHLDVLTFQGSMLERQKTECSFSVLHLFRFILRGHSCLVWPVAWSRGIARPPTNTFLVLGVCVRRTKIHGENSFPTTKESVPVYPQWVWKQCKFKELLISDKNIHG